MGRLKKYYCINGSHGYLFNSKSGVFQKFKKYATPFTSKMDFMFLHKDDIISQAKISCRFRSKYGVYLATVKLLRIVWSVAKESGTNKPGKLVFLHHLDPEPEIKMSSKMSKIQAIFISKTATSGA